MQIMEKLSEETYNKLYVTSDTHFGHDKEFVYKERGYNNTVEMNDDMINIINSTVGSDGILLHLGDFCLNTTREGYLDILSRLKIKELWMLWGNHNNPIQRSYGGTREQVCSFSKGVFIRYLNYYYTFRKGSKEFVCCHFPFASWDNMSKGSNHLTGHSHGHYKLSTPEDKTYKILDVGWDIHRHPLTMQEIETIMATKNSNTLHHD